jgi:hypothetical protein
MTAIMLSRNRTMDHRPSCGARRLPLTAKITLHTMAASPPNRRSIENEIAAPLFASIPKKV